MLLAIQVRVTAHYCDNPHILLIRVNKFFDEVLLPGCFFQLLYNCIGCSSVFFVPLRLSVSKN
jgi:hypothetical protein